MHSTRGKNFWHQRGLALMREKTFWRSTLGVSLWHGRFEMAFGIWCMVLQEKVNWRVNEWRSIRESGRNYKLLVVSEKKENSIGHTLRPGRLIKKITEREWLNSQSMTWSRVYKASFNRYVMWLMLGIKEKSGKWTRSGSYCRPVCRLLTDERKSVHWFCKSVRLNKKKE